MVRTIDSAANTEEFMNHKWIIGDPEKHKVNYFVPNFGKDDSISTSDENLSAAEAKLGAWVP